MFSIIKKLLGLSKKPLPPWDNNWSKILNDKVTFYRALNDEDKLQFEKRVHLFLYTTLVEGGDLEVTDTDRLLVAASAIIPVWAFPKWRYFNLKTVFLLRQSFNENLEFGKPDSLITGMVGTGVLTGKLVLSKPHLHLGFSNKKDKHNVGIHEFVHLIDMADGECDGYPERLKEFSFSTPWFELVHHKIKEINSGQSNIRDYGATNRAEFFSVASEYFFERPQMLKEKHPKLYEMLTNVYQQDAMHIEQDIKVAKNAPCPCGSSKKFKRCCMVAA